MWELVKTGTSGVVGLWRMRILSCTTMPVYEGRATLQCLSESGPSTKADDSGHAGKHAAEWCGQNFHEVNQPHSSSAYI